MIMKDFAKTTPETHMSPEICDGKIVFPDRESTSVNATAIHTLTKSILLTVLMFKTTPMNFIPTSSYPHPEVLLDYDMPSQRQQV